MSGYVVVSDRSGVAEARRAALAVAQAVGFDEEAAGRVGIVATELGTNLVKHSNGGEFLVRSFDLPDGPTVECIALDRGSGIADIDAALRDGCSTAGSPGTGLGAIGRASSYFDIFSQRGIGTAVVARIGRARVARTAVRAAAGSPHWVGVAAIPIAGEIVSGDAWSAQETPKGFSAIVADGLGHGDGAAVASREAIRQFEGRAWGSPREAIERMHHALKPTRGAAIGLCDVDAESNVVTFAGIGNIAAAVVHGSGTKQMVSLHGTVGHAAKRVQQFTYPFVDGASILMCSDGMLTRWSLDGYPGLLERDPALIAGVLFRDFKRGRDDVTVLCVKLQPRVSPPSPLSVPS